MSSRDVILGRVRAALRDQPTVPEIPRAYRREFDPADLDLFVERLLDYKAVVHQGASVADTIKTISGTRTLIIPPGLDRSWLPPEAVTLVDENLPADRIAAADGVVTAAAVGIAETGTIVLDASPDQGRRIISLLPDLHICVIRPDQVVAAVPEAIARLDPTRPLTWISGPSATSDIELNRVEGVHGPRNLHVVFAGAR
ncbi:LUD domain-containing protein [Actinoplanes sp. NPDC051411]|uniref:LutC/YkgG family protein n=1 Tax=Actinoplanes sp. NPDC051411 TaxID=3155522 RepID=UPI0034429C63